jgi:succinate-acetate transporter protein
MILAMGIAYGGLAQIIAGLLEYRRGNTFGTTAFCSYGLFWWCLAALLFMPSFTFFEVVSYSSISMAAYFFMWGVFTAGMFFGTLKANRVLQFVFLSLAILFFLLAAREISGSADIGTFLGYEGIICGLSAIYLALAEVLNDVHGKQVLPIGKIS